MLVAFRGTIDNVDDIFSHSLAVDSFESDPVVVADTIRDMWVDVVTGTNGIEGGLSQTVTYTEVTAAEILDLNLGTLAAAYHSEFATPPEGAGAPGPAQVSMCVSLTAGTRPNGTPIKGRFYLPTAASGITSTDGLFAQGATQGYATRLGQFLDDLNAAGFVPCVWSRALGILSTVGVGGDASSGLRIGRTPDTIRTRRNSLPEEYLTPA